MITGTDWPNVGLGTRASLYGFELLCSTLTSAVLQPEWN